MDIQKLKQNIEEENVQIGFWIFQYTDNSFLPHQYIHEIRKILNKDVQILDDLNVLVSPQKNIFGNTDASDLIRLFVTECFESDNPYLEEENNLIVVCKKVTNEELFKDSIIKFPKLEQWQIKDYVYSIADGVPEEKLDLLIQICKGDIFRISSEASKLSLFTEQERMHVFDSFLEDGVFDDLSEHNIFDFSNAILKKDIVSLAALYKEIEKIDVEPLGLVTILYNNLKSIISIQFDPSITPEILNISPKKFWAIKKYSCGYYTKEQLIQSFYLITDIDRKLKSGEITVDLIVDYIVCHMLSF